MPGIGIKTASNILLAVGDCSDFAAGFQASGAHVTLNHRVQQFAARRPRRCRPVRPSARRW